MNVKELITQYAAGVRDFRGVNLNEANLRGVRLSEINLSGANLNIANLSGANLSRANLDRARLNVARLNAANLSGAKLNRALLNVANLIRADLGKAELVEALIMRAELVRAELSGANLTSANLTGTDLREATLRGANLSYCNLSEVNLRDAILTGAILEQVILSSADISRTDLSGANLRDAELSQANLNRANLSGADLHRANLRWVDLSGANLRWADLSQTKLSGANLIGADLSHANLVNTSLVHADLTQARLIDVEWGGADLTGAILTGTKLHGVSCYGLKTEGLVCDWLDLSPGGDRTQVLRLTPEKAQKFFNQTLPTIQVMVDSPYNLSSNLILAQMYEQIARVCPDLKQAPGVEVSARRTYLEFRVENNEQLFIVAYCAIFPFKDAESAKKHLLMLLEMLQSQSLETLGVSIHQQLRLISANVNRTIEQLRELSAQKQKFLSADDGFLHAYTHTVLTNSDKKTLDIYHHPFFGRRQSHSSYSNFQDNNYTGDWPENNENSDTVLPPIKSALQFIQDFFSSDLSPTLTSEK
ncbi:pentapeptide repeat-containing protein [Oscillatoria sp. FACHB-1406]|uniref:pentapeptide repeat-containing protein n=1 Tax=Oscillatoria sp. FACHB-1406 TaxID=2692846 RepID=UPI001682B495|nr:pentapeptide repeat-containing protein [Oscillatoria sp. FACHB-1406]MBD2578483.1 pentapeptide repeat-containing protein [Oscillatoria sp. FACHB-1406]